MSILSVAAWLADQLLPCLGRWFPSHPTRSGLEAKSGSLQGRCVERGVVDVSECADIQEAASRLAPLGGPRGRLTGVKFGRWSWEELESGLACSGGSQLQLPVGIIESFDKY